VSSQAAGRLDPVKEQYEQWPYPVPPDDLTSPRFGVPYSIYQDLQTLYWAFWPSGEFREDLDILVAGCGTASAAAFAFNNPRALVVGIDVSAASLAHEEFLKKKHGLAHLTLHQCPVEDVASLGRDFDFIAVQGVLHHLADPVRGLQALREVLRPDGVMSVMVYGRYARCGVYMLQELFGLMGLGQTEADVQVVRDALGAVPPEHPVHPYVRRAGLDLSSPNGVVDTFLHKRDRAYSVKACLELVDSAGLAFQGWNENIFYHPEGLGPLPPSVRARLENLKGAELWQAMELFHCLQAMHGFYVCHRHRDPARYRIDLDGDAFPDYVPVARIARATPANPARQQLATIERPPFPPVALDQSQAALFSQVNGEKSVRECMTAVGLSPERVEHLAFARNLFGSLWRVGYVMFRIPPPR
jgi:SAM-dependent methyltransferase